MQARAFNEISIDYNQGYLTKTSSNTTKLRDEVNYYLNLPDKIGHFFPKLISYCQNFTRYTLEYVPYKDLSTLILTNQITYDEAANVLKRLVGILSTIHYFKPSLNNNARENSNFYIKKTRERIEGLKHIQAFKQIVDVSHININGRLYKSFQLLQPEFVRAIQNYFAARSLTTAIHGDFCFSNILYCPLTKNIRLIDPRGSFGNTGIYGNPDYDYAKLLHCMHGHYDFIVNNDFELQESNLNHFVFKRPVAPLLMKLHKYYQTLLSDRGVNLEFSYLIEASLFLSMTALHYECLQRQKALFLTGIIILNNFFDGKYENLH